MGTRLGVRRDQEAVARGAGSHPGRPTAGFVLDPAEDSGDRRAALLAIPDLVPIFVLDMVGAFWQPRGVTFVLRKAMKFGVPTSLVVASPGQ